MLIEAIALTERKDIKVAILGHGPCETQLKALVADFALEDQVSLVGYQSNPYPWISNADGFILSSRYEGFLMWFLRLLHVARQ